MNEVLCIRHADCWDGITAAHVVRKRYPDATFIAAKYGDAPPVVDGKQVIIVDFSYSPEVLVDMSDRANMVIVLDHHKSAIETIQQYFTTHTVPDNLILKLDLEQSGAGLAWRHFFHNTKEPWLVKYVEDRDLWRFQYPETKEVMAAVSLYPMTFESWDLLDKMTADEIRHEGATLLGKEANDINWHLRNASDVVELGGYTVPVINCPKYLTSALSDTIVKDYPFVVCYYDGDGKRTYSLRARKDGIDVSQIAQCFNGGGHKAAAGFVLTHRFLKLRLWWGSLKYRIRRLKEK